MNYSRNHFHIITPDWDELDDAPSIAPAEAVRMTERLASMVSPVPMLLREALDEQSATKGLARTMLRVSHHLSYWKCGDRVIIDNTHGTREAS